MRWIFLGCLLGVSGTVCAQQAVPVDEALRTKWERRFRAADTDGDRMLDHAEARKGLPKVLVRRFDAIDLDDDGRITPEELWAMHEREVAARKQRRQERLRGRGDTSP